MAQDPGLSSARKPDGTPDQILERRLRVLFDVLRNPDSPRPTNPDSALVFLKELHDKLSGR